MPPARRPIAERFWAKVDRRGVDECWPWLGGSSANGYGLISSGGLVGHGGPGFMRQATHVSWEIAHGQPWPVGLQALHTCDNPPCVNPTHLVAGTQTQNIRDMFTRGRGRTGDEHPMRINPWRRRHGADHWLTHLTTDDIRTIRQRHASGVTYADLGRSYSVSLTTIKRIVIRETWRHVE